MTEDVLEKNVKKDIKKYLKSIGAYQFWPVQMGLGARTVDCLVCYKGRFLAIETKRPGGGKVTTKQQKTLWEVKDAGGIALVALSVDIVRFWVGEIDG